MRRPGRAVLAALVAAALLFGACGASDGPDPAAARDLAEVRTEVGSLEDKLATLQAELDESRRDVRRGDAALERKLTRLADRLSGAASSLRESIASAEQASGNASSNASSALSEAQSVARDVSVLSNRLDYHLRTTGGR